MIWHFCEIFLMPPVAYLSGPLQNWIQKHISIETPGLDTWEKIYHFLIRGDLISARDHIRTIQHPQLSDQDLLLLDQILEAMPTIAAHSHITEFELYWNQWHNECENFMNNHTICNLEPVKILFQIITGHLSEIPNSTWKKRQPEWLERLLAEILYNKPTTSNHEARFLPRYRTSEDSVNRLLESIIELDVLRVIQQLADKYHVWFVAHFCDFLFHCKYHISISTLAHLREDWLIEYTNFLSLDANHWQLAASYLAYCEQQGKFRLQILIERVPLDSEQQAFKLLNLCRTHNFTVQAQSISRVMAMKYLREKRRVSCMDWLFRVEDHARIAQAANKMIASATDVEIPLVLQSFGNYQFSEQLAYLSAFQQLAQKKVILF
jgi:nuclear pore complex protein Nup85